MNLKTQERGRKVAKSASRYVFLIVGWLSFAGCAWLTSLSPFPTASQSATQTLSPQPIPSSTVLPTAENFPTDVNRITPASTEEASNAQGEWDGFASGLIPSQQQVLQQMEGATLYEIDVFLPDDLETLHATQRVTYTNREDTALDHLIFYLYPNHAGGELTILSLQVEGVNTAWSYDLDHLIMEIALDPVLSPGDSLQLEMEYDLTIPRQMGGNYGLFGFFSNILVLDQFYPLVAMYDERGWLVREIPPNADVTFNDISFYHVRVNVPADLVVVASGVTLAASLNGGRQTIEIAAGPVRDFYLAASKDFIVLSDRLGETTVNSYAMRGYEAGARLALDTAMHALQVFSSRFHIYPYSEYDVVSTPMQALGMEYPGLAAISRDLYPEGETLYGLSTERWLESVVVHETGHQWFYNLVGNDQIEEPWVDEALTQYATNLYFLDRYGEEAAAAYRQDWYGRWARVNRAPIPIGKPAGSYSSTEYSAIIYGRGPIFLKTLEEQMGAEVFWAFLQDYVEMNLWETGSAEEFRAIAESHCTCDLSSLWAAWVEE